MATETEQLVVSLEARIRDFERNFQKANKTVSDNFSRIESRARQSGSRLQREMNTASAGVVSQFQAMGAGIMRVFGIGGIGVTGIVAAIKSAASSLAEVRAEAQRAGIASETFQELAYAAEQSHVKIDALTDGMKELQLRADEFVDTGKGPAAEAFQRIGLSPADVKARLQDPAAFLEEIIRRVERLDKAAQIRIFDELFGGTGGEQFVRFLDSGADGLARLRQEARDTGNVLSDDVLKRAEEIDRRFNEISRTVGTKLKAAIVSAVGAMVDFWNSMTPEGRDNALAKELEKAEAGIKTFEAMLERARSMNANVTAAQLEKRLGELRAERDALMRAATAVDLDKTSGESLRVRITAPAPIARILPADIQKEADKFIEAGTEARLSAYRKALKDIDDAYTALTKKIVDAGLTQQTEDEILQRLELAREAQLAGLKEKNEAEELALAKVERAQQAMRDELSILQDGSKNYEQITKALKEFNFHKEFELELEKKAKELRALGVGEEDINRLIAAQRELAVSTLHARDAFEQVGKRELEAKELTRDIAQEFTRTAAAIVFQARNAKEAVSAMGLAIGETLLQAALIKPATKALESAFTSIDLFSIFSAKGNAFVGGNVVPMARGGAGFDGILRQPTAFPMRGGGMAVGGELADEAILPLRRLPNGELGVGAIGSGGGQPGSVIVNTPINITVEGGSQGPQADREMAMRISGQVRDVVRAEVADVLRQQMRPGNMLNPVHRM